MDDMYWLIAGNEIREEKKKKKNKNEKKSHVDRMREGEKEG